jgi:tRNA pseudouridine13 synthase
MDWEIACGISRFIQDGKDIGGNLKHLVEDFVVNEIDREGNVITYEEDRAREELPQEHLEEIKIKSELEVSSEAENALHKIMQSDDVSRFKEFIQSLNAGNAEDIYEVSSIPDKPSRTEFHMLIKHNFPGLTSCTATDNSQVTIKVYSSEGISSNRKKRKLNLDARPQFKLPAKFIEFVMWKYNIESMSAVKLLAKAIGAKDKQFGMAGNKDKRGITTQKLTTYASLLPRLRSFENTESVKIGHFKYTDSDIGIGDLKGNRFTITLRNISLEVSKEEILESIEYIGIQTLRNKGFINYFGLQRFGNSQDNATHKVGLAIIKKDFAKAVEIILGPRDTNSDQERKARENYISHKDPSRALEEFPKFCVTSI